MKANTIYIHVGTHKTGTTALQNFFYLNMEALLKKSVCYPRPGPGVVLPFQHASLAFKLEEGRCQEVFEFIMHFSRSFKVVLLSSEVFLRKSPNRPYGTARELAVLKRCAASVKIIIYLRRQDHYVESFYQEMVKNPKFRVTDIFGEFEENNSGGEYLALLDHWASVFGKENIIVRPYEKQQFIGGTVFLDFLNILKIDWDDNFVIPDNSKSNVGFVYDVLELTRLSNRYRSEVEQRSFLKLLKLALGENFLKRPDEKYSFLSPPERVELLNKYQDTNSKIAHQFLNREDGRLFYEPWPDVDEPWEPYKLSLEKTAAIFTGLIVYLHQQNEQLKNRVNQMLRQVGEPVRRSELDKLGKEIEALRKQHEFQRKKYRNQFMQK